ncbi:hypothetical protein AUK18_01505 [Candidatus Beckwithbacteria bacterium CG2_30_44_31]|uniref:Uncharacterized protein n=1 Tax=Candidatus Beckwithbacteria bacterium CG2_30_44_31 TaxID=1805035 RepID=A0A1J5B9U0_9BACT|nr:MAG: hypothetical protein AUK18_01505 [Candidatus Beckwithbacteria bacterium CG2_30_44_31]
MPESTVSRGGLSLSLHDAEIAELPELKQFVVITDPDRPDSEMIQVDNHFLFMTGKGEHKWSRDPKAYLKTGAIFFKGGDSRETPLMKQVREKIEVSKTYAEFMEAKNPIASE